MKKPMSTAVTVIAVIHLIAAALGVCGLLLQVTGVATALSQGGPGGPGADPGAKLNQEMLKVMETIPGHKAYEGATIAVNALLTVLLIAAGIGLLNGKAWARMLS